MEDALGNGRGRACKMEKQGRMSREQHQDNNGPDGTRFRLRDQEREGDGGYADDNDDGKAS